MNYVEVKIGKNFWLVPDYISKHKTYNLAINPEPTFKFARRKPPVKEHSNTYFIDLNVKKEIFKDKVVVDYVLVQKYYLMK